MTVLFNSITSSLRVQKILSSQGIPSKSIQTTKNAKLPQCGHALKLDKAYKSNILKAADALGVKIKGIYYENDIS